MSRFAPPSSQDQRYVDNISNDYAFVRDRSQRLLNKKGSLPNMYNAYSQREVKDYAPTQMTSCNRASSASAVLIKKPQYRIRKLTPKECWRLMGFPDEAFEKAKSAGISNSQLYKQAGNSIVVDVLYYMFRNLFKENEKVSVNELFSGIGAQRAALERLGIEHNVVGISEIDKYAIKSYTAIYGETRNYGDISKAEKLDYADFWTYSFPCFTGDTLVLTKDNGYVPIKDIKIGDEVLTHTNSYKTVLESKMTGVKNIYQIRAMSFDELKCTENHLFYVRTRHRVNTHVEGKAVHYRYFDEPVWKECRDLTKNDYLGYAINQNSIIPEWNGINLEWSDGRKTRFKNQLSELMANEDFWWVIGRYIADGWKRKGGGIVICCGKSKKGQIEERLDELGFNYNISEERTAYKYHIPIKELSLFVEPFGYKAYGKFIPSFVLDMPTNLCEAFLKGYWSGDGCFTNNMYKATTVSRELVYGLGQLIAKVYYTPFAIYKTKRKPQTVIEGRVVNQRDTYSITFKKTKDVQDKAFYENGYVWFPISSITNTLTEEEVYDITVDNDHSFTANGCIVHNCTDISVAGKQKGITKGETRSGLLYEVERLLNAAKDSNTLPKYLMLENVKNLVGKKFKPQFDEWLSYLDSMGYNTYWQVLNAKDYGVPQNRERVFAISIRKDIDNGTFKFPKPFDNGIRLKDILEDEVDEKFYITNEKADKLIDELIESGELNGE